MGRNDHLGFAVLPGRPLPARARGRGYRRTAAVSNHLAMTTNAWGLFIRAMGLPLNYAAEPPGPSSRAIRICRVCEAPAPIPQDLRVPAESARAGGLGHGEAGGPGPGSSRGRGLGHEEAGTGS